MDGTRKGLRKERWQVTRRYIELSMLGFPSGRRSALIAGLGEVCGDVFLAFGLLTRAAAALLLQILKGDHK